MTYENTLPLSIAGVTSKVEYTIDGRGAYYRFLDKEKVIDINPLTPLDDIIDDISYDIRGES